MWCNFLVLKNACSVCGVAKKFKVKNESHVSKAVYTLANTTHEYCVHEHVRKIYFSMNFRQTRGK